MILLWINVDLYEVREVTAPEADVPVIQRRTSQSELFHCRAPHCNKKTHFRAGKHLFTFQKGESSSMWCRRVTGQRKGTSVLCPLMPKTIGTGWIGICSPSSVLVGATTKASVHT